MGPQKYSALSNDGTDCRHILIWIHNDRGHWIIFHQLITMGITDILLLSSNDRFHRNILIPSNDDIRGHRNILLWRNNDKGYTNTLLWRKYDR